MAVASSLDWTAAGRSVSARMATGRPFLLLLALGLAGRGLLGRGLLGGRVHGLVVAECRDLIDLLVRHVHDRAGVALTDEGHQAASLTTAKASVSMIAVPYTTSARSAIWFARFRSPEPSGSPKRMTSIGTSRWTPQRMAVKSPTIAFTFGLVTL